MQIVLEGAMAVMIVVAATTIGRCVFDVSELSAMPRFSLRLAFVLLLAFGVLLGWFVPGYQVQRYRMGCILGGTPAVPAGGRVITTTRDRPLVFRLRGTVVFLGAGLPVEFLPAQEAYVIPPRATLIRASSLLADILVVACVGVFSVLAIPRLRNKVTVIVEQELRLAIAYFGWSADQTPPTP